MFALFGARRARDRALLVGLVLTLGLPLAAMAGLPARGSNFTALQPPLAKTGTSNKHGARIAPYARPSGSHVVRGRGVVERTADAVVITQHSATLVVVLQQVKLGRDAKLIIQQPSPAALLVIRVRNPGRCAVFGQVLADARVRLVCPHGIRFGRSARVQAGSLVATTQGTDAGWHMEDAASLHGAIMNRGDVRVAAGGTVALLGSRVINQGYIRAPGGAVRLLAHDGNTLSSGDIDVSGTHGGSVQLLSDRNVGVMGGTINASGRAGGGSIRIGGSYQGGQGLQHAERTYVSADAVLNADATEHGDGGTLVLWSDDNTVSAGMLSARGGEYGGDGGLIETSSHGGLSVTRAADASAAHGEAGTWLLDPNNIEIVAAGGDANITGSTPFQSTDDTAKLTVGTLKAALTGGTDVTVQTMSAGADTEDGVITFTANLDYDGIGSGGTLTLDADRHIAINGSITDGTTATADSLGLVLTGGGAVTFNNAVNVASLDVTSAGDIMQTATGVLTVAGASSFAAGAHAIILDNTGNHFTGAVSLANSGSNAVLLDNGNNALKLGTVDVGSGALTIQNYAGPLSLTGDVTTEGSQVNFTTAVSVAAASITIDTTGNGSNTAGANIIFGNTLDGATAGTNSLILQAGTAGNIILGGMVGNGQALKSLYTSGDNIVFSGGAVTTTSSQVYDAAVVVNNAATLTGVGITFNKVVDGSGGSPRNLTIHGGTAAVDFNDAVGGGFALGALAIDGSGSLSFAGGVEASSLSSGTGTVTLGGNVITSGAQTYNGALLLGTGITLATSDSNVHFKGAVDNAVNGTPQTLTVNAGTGAVDFDATLGGNNGALGAVTLSGSGATSLAAVTAASLDTGTGDITLHGDVSTSGSQTYDGALLLDGSGNSVALSATNITFGGAVVSAASGTPQALTLNLAGPVASVFNKAVGSGNGALGALTVVNTSNQIQFKQAVHAASLDVAGDAVTFASISTTAAQTWGGDLQLLNASTLQSGSGGITFNGNVLTPMPGTPLTVDAGSGAVAFNAGVSVGGLTATAAGGITQGGGSTLNIGGATTLDAGNSAITLALAGNDFHDTVNLSGGTTQLVDSNALSLGTLNTGALTVTSGAALNLGSGNVNGNLSATSSAGGISQTGALNITGTATLAATGAAVTLTGTGNDFHSGVSASGDGVAITDTNDLTITSLTVSNNGDVSLIAGGLLGPAQAINAGSGNITLAANGGSLTTLALTGTDIDLTGRYGITLVGNVTAAGTLDLTSTNATIMQLGGLFSAFGVTTVNAGSGTITLANVGNDFQDTVNLTGGTTQLVDSNALTLGTLAVGDLTVSSGNALNLGSGAITGNLSATSNGGDISQTGALEVVGVSLLDAGSGAITLTASGNKFTGAVDIAHAGDVQLAGSTLTLGTVANTTSLQLDDAATLTGDITVNGGWVNLNGAVTLGAPTITIDAAAGGGSINFADTINGAAAGSNSLVLNADSSGAVIFGGKVGDAVAPGTLTVTAGTTVLTGGAVHTTGKQSYNGALAVNNAATLTAEGLIVNGTVDSAGTPVDLTLNAGSGDIAFNGAVGGTFPLGALRIGGAGDLVFAGIVDAASIDLTASGTISATATITGDTTLHAGTLEPGTNGTGGAITGSYTQMSGATLHVTIGMTGSHKLAVSGSASLAGILEVDFANNPGEGDEFTVLSTASRNGTFDSLVSNGLASSLAAKASHDATSVSVKVVNATPDLTIAVDDSRTYARYGQLLTYVVTVHNQGDTDATQVDLSNDFPASQLNADFTTWVCLPGSSEVVCNAIGSGPLTDSNVEIPAGDRVYWLVSTSVRGDAPGSMLDNKVTLTAVDPHSASDSDVLVMFRDGFEGPGSLSPSASPEAPPAPSSLRCTRRLDSDQTLLFMVPDSPAAVAVEPVVQAVADDGSGFRVERTTLGQYTHLRLVGFDQAGREWASAWVRAKPGARIALGTATSAGGPVVLLEGAARALSLPLTGKMVPFTVTNQATATCHPD